MAKIIAISNRKGGTGKTTVAVNLAAELAALGRRVLLVDLDSQGHCAAGLGVKVDKGAPTAHDIFLDPQAKPERGGAAHERPKPRAGSRRPALRTRQRPPR